MAPPEKVRARIAEIIARPANVEFDEIVWVMKQLGSKQPRQTKHGFLLKIDGHQPLMLNKHNNGKQHLPTYCVEDFRELMIELGLYAEYEDYEDD